MNKKQVLRMVAFLLVTAVMVYILCDIFESSGSLITERYKKYTQLEEGTVDAVYLGTSGVDRYWIAGQAFEEYGMTVYPLSSDGCPSWLMINYLKQALKFQSPQLVIVDVRDYLSDPREDFESADARARKVIDLFGFFSANRMDAIKRTKERLAAYYPDKIQKGDMSFFFPVIRFHEKWESFDIHFEDLTDPPSEYLGFHMLDPYSYSTFIREEVYVSDKEEPLEQLKEQDLYELIDFVKDNDLDLLFVNSPRDAIELEVERTNSLRRIVEEEGFTFLDYNLPEMVEAYPFVLTEDFYNETHTNYYGAVKYTTYFSAYLDEHYDLPDHRDDERCADWYGVADKIADQIAKWKKDKE